MNRFIIIAFFCLPLIACADRWSELGAGGAQFKDVEPVCRAKAHASAIQQLPTPYDREYGAAGVPPMTRRDIERRETARCLEGKGFTLSREWR